MENIKLKDGIVVEITEAPVNLEQLEAQYAEMISGIADQQANADILKAKIDHIKSLKSQWIKNRQA